MNSGDVLGLLFVFFILSIFIDILFSKKKKRRNYSKKTKKITENQKIAIIGIFLAIILMIYFPKTIFLFIMTLTCIGIYLFLKHNKILDIFKKNNLDEPFKKNSINTKINRTKEAKKRAGNNYEKEVGKYYEKLGYKVKYNGLEKGYLDEGIDLIASNENRTLLIQCKNWQKSIITIEEIYYFLDNCNKFTSKYNFQTKEIIKIFVVANKKKNFEIEEFIQRNQNVFEYKEIPYLNVNN